VPATSQLVIVDDRLLIEELLMVLAQSRRVVFHTTSYWYYPGLTCSRAGCGWPPVRAFRAVGERGTGTAILSLLELRPDILLPDPRQTVLRLARIAKRHPRLNLSASRRLPSVNFSAARCGFHVRPPTVFFQQSSIKSMSLGRLSPFPGHDRTHTRSASGSTEQGPRGRPRCSV
jgi:hypothetical protein